MHGSASLESPPLPTNLSFFLLIIFLLFLLIIFLLFIFFFLTINLLLSSLRSSAFALSFSPSLSSAPAPSFPLFVGDFLFSLFSPLCFLICFQACLLLCNKCTTIYYQWSYVMVSKLTPHHRLKQINEIHTCSQLYKYVYIYYDTPTSSNSLRILAWLA